ncbi:glucose-6-phosphate dehydrogenase [Paenibacillus aceris]|uniref:Glucose-6-phosphate 1-dehydrogenase n=1 Tax=Paenibacillus aceris TaxID=869555 RepID=A0ABS4HQI8_9BACL|nr:glucose-6-phosphate dehydrogenase [Paenibacillus aceris]MBP1960877.1 glucose-6-phosphate 1-dehydrogenase [Paenibacillus aceris]NHW35454.1 glucose-6-phosphate dehydrogenase [Paenibacillus aceris]
MEPATFVLFGATGDLAKRKIYPALFQLFVDQKLPPSFSLIGLGRRGLSHESFQANVEQSLITFSRSEVKDADVMKKFLRAFRYHVLDIDRKEDYTKLLRLVEERENELNITPNRMFYLSVGPEFFETIAANIHESGLDSANGWKRLVIEKPFGHDLSSARQLNTKLNQAFNETEIYRIDHYLGKPMVQQIGHLLHSALSEQEYRTRKIASVQITANEVLGVEERAGYYDHAGAIRDMFQNHMLQLLMMLTIELPNRSSVEEVGKLKRNVMKALKPLNKTDVTHHIIRGQYGAGEIQGEQVVGYTDEPGIELGSHNDTFIAARLQINDPFWKDTPIYIRTGKRLKEKATRIVIEFNSEGPLKDLLIIEIGPNERIFFQRSQSGMENSDVEIPIRSQHSFMKEVVKDAYEILIHDALIGDKTYFAHWDEVELSWEWVQPILDAYRENLLPLHIYPAGTYGPSESDKLLEIDGFHWWFDAKNVSINDATKGESFEAQKAELIEL